jgi:3-deoxy-D-manno-octulosonic-acid transferase
VSLGETKASIAFALEAKKAYPEATLLYSSVTETGFDEVEKSLPFITDHFFLPFDFSWIIRPLVKKINPTLVVFIEGDLWLNFLEAAKEVGAKTLLINGKISETSFKRYLLFKNYAKWVFSSLDSLCLQNTLYLERFKKIYPPKKEIPLFVTGNIKLDASSSKLSLEEQQKLKDLLGISSQHQVITIGSTHSKEEELLLKTLKPLIEQNPLVKIILVPRHPERFPEVEHLCIKHNLSYIKWSNLEKRTGQEPFILIDTVGILRRCYQVSTVAIVAGSFVDIGGHNLLEPAEYGVPAIFGPYIHKQIEFARLATESGIGFKVSIEELLPQLNSLLNNESLRKDISIKAYQLLESCRGASIKSWDHAKKLLLNSVNHCC